MTRSPDDTAAIQQRLKALGPMIKGIFKVAGAQGISLAVSNHCEPIYRTSFGFADLETKKVATGSTRFPIGTMAKTFTAAAISALVADGKMEWDTPFKRIIPELQTTSATVTKSLTIVDLLSHRSGLGRSNYWWQGAEATLLLKKNILPYYNALPNTGQFRASWAYSNWGYALVGEVIERVSGKTYAQYLKEKVYTPLGMENTTVDPMCTSVALGLASPYAALDDSSHYPLPQPPVTGGTIMDSALGGVSTVDDLMNYSIGLMEAFPRRVRFADKQLTPGYQARTTSVIRTRSPFCPVASLPVPPGSSLGKEARQQPNEAVRVVVSALDLGTVVYLVSLA